jgi:uncharacterized membrane protein YccC
MQIQTDEPRKQLELARLALKLAEASTTDIGQLRCLATAWAHTDNARLDVHRLQQQILHEPPETGQSGKTGKGSEENEKPEPSQEEEEHHRP